MDNYKSRKLVASAVGFIAPFLVASYAMLFGDKATFAEWSSLMMWLVPGSLGVYVGANVLEKFKK